MAQCLKQQHRSPPVHHVLIQIQVVRFTQCYYRHILIQYFSHFMSETDVLHSRKFFQFLLLRLHLKTDTRLAL
jgi:hypothetical protein